MIHAMDAFSDALLSLARPCLGWAVEQHARFQSEVPPGRTRCDLTREAAWVGDRELNQVGELGTYAEDLTFMWAWAKRSSAGIEHSLRLKELGEQNSVPELTTELVDLGHFPDPKLAADHLATIALGLLAARGVVKFNHGGRAYTYLVTDDAGLAIAHPDPSTVAAYLRTGTEMLPGGGARTVVTGYAEHHRLVAQPVPEGVWVDLPGGHRLLARISEQDHLDDATVIRPDGGPLSVATVTTRPAQHQQTPFMPDDLLAKLAPRAAIALGLKGGLLDHVKELRELENVHTTWDPVSGTFGFTELPDVALHAAEIGEYHRDTKTWVWASGEWDGVTRLRALAREHDADHIAADRVDLRESPHPENSADLLAMAAVDLGDGLGSWC